MWPIPFDFDRAMAQQYFNLDPEDPEWAARWNVAPTQEVATIRQDRKEPKRRFAKMRWGLIPYWAKNGSFAASTINAASETASEKPAFRDLFPELVRHLRCGTIRASIYQNPYLQGQIAVRMLVDKLLNGIAIPQASYLNFGIVLKTNVHLFREAQEDKAVSHAARRKAKFGS